MAEQSTPPSDLDIHLASLRRFEGSGASGADDAIRFGLNEAIARGLRKAADFESARRAEGAGGGGRPAEDFSVTTEVEGPYWMGHSWGKVATITLTGAGQESAERTLHFPTLLDEKAVEYARQNGRGLRIGSFRGTYWGRGDAQGHFRQPLVTYSWAPGVHKLAPQPGGSGRHRVLLVGEFARQWGLTIDRPTREDRKHLADGGHVLDKGDRVLRVRARRYKPLPPESLVLPLKGLDYAAVAEYLRGDRLFVGALPDDRELKVLVDWLEAVDPIQPTGVTPSAAHTAEAKPTMHPDHWSATGIGDLLAASVATAVAGIPLRDVAASDVEWLASRVRAAAQGAIDAVAIGRADHSGSVIAEHPGGTLARLEAARQRTFVGFGGLESYQGRLDLRTLPPEWRGRLCALQTQESSDIGLVRYAALADLSDGAPDDETLRTYRDLSAAASLIPFIGHDDPTRAALGSKMLKQAVVLKNREAPLVRTGMERVVADAAGVTRAPAGGEVGDADAEAGFVQIGNADIPIGFQASGPGHPQDAWLPVAGRRYAREGAVLAHAPDVVLEEGDRPVLACGLNATVAFLAWEGFNYEDGIVVSESFAQRMSSEHLVRLSTSSRFGMEEPDEMFEEGVDGAPKWRGEVPAGTVLLRDLGGGAREFRMPETGYLIPVDRGDGYSYSARSSSSAFAEVEFDATDSAGFLEDVSVSYRVERPLQIGDKLTTRHGGKGVVTRIVPDEEMPRIQLPPRSDGTGRGERVVEVLLNPLGVIKRLNMGTVMELAQGLDQALAADDWDSASPTVAPRALGREGRLALADRLAERRAAGGKLPLKDVTGSLVGPEGGRVMVGPLYLVKLNHLAKAKGGARGDAAASPMTFQPVKSAAWVGDRRRSAPQRIGEMELWSLEAIGASRAIDDLFATRGIGDMSVRNATSAAPDDERLLPGGLRAALNFLAVAGVDFTSDSEGVVTPSPRDISLSPIVGTRDELVRALWRGGDLGSGLEDAVAEFAVQARSEAAKAGYDALARKVFELATREPARDTADPAARERLRFEIVLPEAVDHPWNVKKPKGRPGEGEEWRVLPPLKRLAILPPALVNGTLDIERDPMIRRYLAILEWVLIYDNLKQRSKRSSRPDLEGEALRRIAKNVRGLLGRLGDADENPHSIAGRLSGKLGLLRRNGLGATATNSGRAVLVGDPTLDPEQVRLPAWMAEDLGVDHGLGYVDVVVVNRQPTLHPYNFQALRAVGWEDRDAREVDANAVALHPILLKSIAGDFDGDTVAVHRPATERARQEMWELRRPSAALRSGASGELLAKLDQDVELGFGLARAKSGGSVSEQAKRAADKLVGSIPLEYEIQREEALEAVARLQTEALKAAGTWGPSVIALDPAANPGIASDLNELHTYARDLHPGFATGAAGRLGSDGVRQWLVSWAKTTDDDEQPPVVRGNYLDGLESEDYFTAAQPAIEGIAKKKLVTPFAGALTRSLVRNGYEITITTDDCGGHPGRETPSILDCRETAGVCAEAYGPNRETGLRVEVGDAVGIRAALFIGEKGTQRALKSIHDRSGRDEGRDRLRELAGILLRDGVGYADGFGRGGIGTFRVPAPFAADFFGESAAQGDDESAAEGADGKLIRHKDLEGRVRKAFPDLASDRDVVKRMCEVLVARCEEILPDLDPTHAAVLIRQRMLRHERYGKLLLPEGAPFAAPPDTTPALPTAVWTGNLAHLVLTLGVTATYDEKRKRLVPADPAVLSEDQERRESSASLAASPLLSTTIRNARRGGDDA